MPWYISNRCHNSVQLNRRTIQKHKIKRISTAEMKTIELNIRVCICIAYFLHLYDQVNHKNMYKV
jgi:hypothetical protein